MARTLDIATTRTAGFALLKPAEKPHLDATRIATLSGTFAVNLLALGLLMLPLTLPTPLPMADHDTDPDIIWIKRDPPVPPLPVEIVRTPRQPEVTPTIQPPRTMQPAPIETVSTPVLTNTGTELANDTAAAETTGPVTSIEPASTLPTPTQLQYRQAPAPTYPRTALREGITGTVMLQVLVGIDGHPLEVTILQSSGNRQLDAAARTQVLKRWSFQPAMKNGQPVQAIGMVPIDFKLQ